MKSKSGLVPAVLLALLLGLAPALAQVSFDFMPKGGKILLLQLLGDPPDAGELRKITGARRNEQEWTKILAPKKGAMSDNELRTLANYLAVNIPLAEGALVEAEKKGDVSAALPPDGQQLAVNQCQFCHALFSSYLVHDRDATGWLGTFMTPAHHGLQMTEKERETFARYSAINMPMKIEDVPEDLRF